MRAAALIFVGASSASAQSLQPPWSASTTSSAAPTEPSTRAPIAPSDAPPPPPVAGGGTSPATPWAPPPGQSRPSSQPAPSRPTGTIEFTSDDTAVDVYLVTGMREVTQLLPMAAPTPATFGSFGGPFGGPFAGSTGFGPVPPVSSSIDPMMSTDLVPVRTTVEQRRFVCRTPCTATLPLGTQSIHFRTANAPLGTDSIDVTQQGSRYRVRTASAGLYALGQASLWVGVGVVTTGLTLLVQGQLACPRGTCSIVPGALTTGAGLIAIGAAIPLIVHNGRRAERLGVRSIAIAPTSITVRW
ncbi:MAG: hypothetical protein JNK05_11560 [Myxococcales bacterium]|nr:hypothetical protein [Myxococcales bacterium]